MDIRRATIGTCYHIPPIMAALLVGGIDLDRDAEAELRKMTANQASYVAIDSLIPLMGGGGRAEGELQACRRLFPSAPAEIIYALWERQLDSTGKRPPRTTRSE